MAKTDCKYINDPGLVAGTWPAGVGSYGIIPNRQAVLHQQPADAASPTGC